MSAVDQMRDMINQLMGSDRAAEDGRALMPFTDPRVCKTFLVGACPHDVLASTRMDMGECSKIHELALRADYEKAQQEKDYFYDVEAHDVLDRFFYDCDHKMELAKKKLLETQEELPQEAAEKAEAVLQLNEQIGKTLAEAEKLGEEGQVTESLALMAKLETLKKEKQEADSELRSAMPASSYQQQKLRVCEVCAAYLGIHDNDRRLADHFGGKLHVGFVFLREKYAELKATVEQRRAQRDAARRGGDAQGDNRRSTDSRSTRDRSDYRRRSRSRDRDHGSSRSERDRDRRDRDRGGGSSSSSRRDRDDSSRSTSRRDRSRSPHGTSSSSRYRRDSREDRGRHENGSSRR